MSPLNSLVNYIIFLGVGLQGVLAAPTATDDLSADSADSMVQGDGMYLERVSKACSPSMSKYPGNQWYVLMNDMMCACNAGTTGPLVRDDYRYTRGIGYHKIHTDALNWNQARKVCLKEGGHLAVINSITEATIIMDMSSRAGTINGATYQGQLLLGMQDMFLEGDFTTVLDYQLQSSGYTAWAPGQPDNGGGRGQNCGSMFADGTLDDFDCDLPLGYVCEIAEIRLF